VLDAARELAPDDVTLAAIGAKLGVTSPALYRYFDDRTAILEALANEAREELTPPSEDLAWDEWLREAARKERNLWRSHPDLYDAANYRAMSAPMTKMAIAGLRVLLGAGFTRDDALSALTIASEVAHAIGNAETKAHDVTAMREEDRAELIELLGLHDSSPFDYDKLLDASISIAIDGMRLRLPKKRRK
jgi:AcrR family transcriptional regulator